MSRQRRMMSLATAIAAVAIFLLASGALAGLCPLGQTGQVQREDHFPDSQAVVTIEPLGMKVVLTGPTTICVDINNVTDLSDACHAALAMPPRPPDGPNGLDEVPTEMVELSLMGGGVTLSLRDPAKSPFKRSTGQIEENENHMPGVLEFPTCSFFDVFFEVDVPGTGILHNESSLAMVLADLPQLPPGIGNIYKKGAQAGGCIELFDEQNHDTGMQLCAASHTPDPRCDVDNDGDVDANDLKAIKKATQPGPFFQKCGNNATIDRCDANMPKGDGVIDSLDVKLCSAICTKPRCR